MNLLLLLQMAADGRGDQVAVVADGQSLTAAELLQAACVGAGLVRPDDGDGPDQAQNLVLVATNGLAFPIGLFAAAVAEVPFVPLNYRLGDDQLVAMLEPLGRSLVVAEGSAATALAAAGHRVMAPTEFVAAACARGGGADEVGDLPFDGEATAVLLHTSGTTAAPKAAVLRHRHLSSYVITTVEFGGADPDQAVLVSVPPYHVAGLANLLSNLYLGRRVVYLTQFDAQAWVDTVRREQITNAMVVPTMLARICDVLEAEGSGGEPGPGLPSLRALSYGGARTPATLLQRVMALLPDVDLTNAYGLTETSSTIAILGPDDHRAARSGDPVAVGRLSSAGQILPTVEIEIRDEDGAVLLTEPGEEGQPGEIWVRGEQVSGEYQGRENPLDAEGWFPTKDRGWVDADGYLFIEGRSDDTIIRGGENIAPAEIEEALLAHPYVAECAVVGLPDEEWGQRIAAVVVRRADATVEPDELREFVRGQLRGSKTPDEITFVEVLPYTETGKLLRRTVVADLLGDGDG